MDNTFLSRVFSLEGKTAVITGGGGVLCSSIATGLARVGAHVAVLDLSFEKAHQTVVKIAAIGGEAMSAVCDVLDRASIESAAEKVLHKFNRVDILINGAGGNKMHATTGPNLSFFDLPPDALQWVLNLNLLGTILPSQVFGRLMANQGSGNILNISSMNAFRPLTRTPVYSPAKAGVSNFTQWLAVHMAQEYSPAIRVNAIAPGFFLTEQNRFLLTNEQTGDLQPRGEAIISHTPMARFGEPGDLVGTAIWLLSPASAFVTGTVIAVDGGFSAYSGV